MIENERQNEKEKDAEKKDRMEKNWLWRRELMLFIQFEMKTISMAIQ